MVDRFGSLFASTMLLVTIPAIAMEADQKDHDHDETEELVESQRAHVHGAWQLFAALDGKTLSMTLLGPLADLAETEHPAGSPEEAAALNLLRDKITDLAPLVRVSKKAKCALTTSPIIEAVSDHDDHDDELVAVDHQDDHQDHDDHADHADHADGDDHDHDHSDEEDHASHPEGEATHGSDIEIVYEFSCKSPNKLGTVDVLAFETFDAIEQIDAVFLSDATQVADRLSPSNKTLSVD